MAIAFAVERDTHAGPATRRMIRHYLARSLSVDRAWFDEEWRAGQIHRLWAWVTALPEDDELVLTYALAFDPWLDRAALWTEAFDSCERALATARALKRVSDEASLLNRMGMYKAKLGEVSAGTSLVEQAAAVHRSAGDPRGEAMALHNLGTLRHRLGDLAGAGASYEAQVEAARQSGDARMEGIALSNLALSYSDRGNATMAIPLFERRIAIAKVLADREGERIATANMGHAYRRLGDLERALALYSQSLDLARATGARLGEANALEFIGLGPETTRTFGCGLTSRARDRKLCVVATNELDLLTNEQRVWLAQDSALRARAAVLAAELDRDADDVYKTLRHLARTPSERLALGLRHGRLRRSHRA